MMYVLLFSLLSAVRCKIWGENAVKWAVLDDWAPDAMEEKRKKNWI